MPQVTVDLAYKPHAKQLLLHNSILSFDDISITLFGGARGAGKSAGILMDAVFFATTYPGAKCAIFREKIDAVKQSFLDKLPSLLPQMCRGVKIYEYREKSSSFYPSRCIVFPNKSYITLQRCANKEEAEAFRGWEFHYLAIDECTLIEEQALEFLKSCVRSAVILNPVTGKELKIPTKIVYGCNPGGVSHKYIKENYIDTTVVSYSKDHHTPLETKDYVSYYSDPASGQKLKQVVRFIPASYKDNPYLNKGYIMNLLKQPEHMKERDVYGNWDIVAGRMFSVKPDQRLNATKTRIALDTPIKDIYIAIDWGYKPSYHSAHWYAVLEDKRILVFKELYGQELIFEDFVKKIKEESEGMEIVNTLLPHDMFRHGDNYRDSTGKIIGETKSDVFEYNGLNPIGVESGKGKVGMRYDKIHSALEIKNNDGVSMLRISESCENLLDELDHAIYSDDEVGKIARACKDHAIDDLGLFLVFYSDDICPFGEEPKVVDTRNKFQRLIEEEEEKLFNKDVDDDEEYIACDLLL